MFGANVRLSGLIAAALVAAPAAAANPPTPFAAPSPIPPVVTAPAPLSAAAVAAFYQARGEAPIWLRDATTIEAARRLVAILKRAPLDGLSNGPELAAQVEAAIARAQAAPAAVVSEQDRLLSSAWVLYVQALRAPIRGMAYGDPALEPKVPEAKKILAEAAKAASLLQHVEAIAAVNPIYAQLRDAAWAQASLGGGAAIDPRLSANLERARVLPASGRFVLVDAATARMFLYEDGRIADTMKVVVGKRDSPTPMLAGTIHYATFNPYWNIPSDVIQRTVAPLVLKRGTKYLRAAQYEVASDYSDQAKVVPPDEIDWKAVAAGTTEIRIRQLPGSNNMMGAIKFGFVNDLGIYLHDTPQRNLFDKARRTFSLGCVRVEDAQRFARWLLGREPVAPSPEPEQHVQLAKGVPIYITYLTAHSENGQVAFTEDVYGFDPKPETGLAATSVDPSPTATTASPQK